MPLTKLHFQFLPLQSPAGQLLYQASTSSTAAATPSTEYAVGAHERWTSRPQCWQQQVTAYVCCVEGRSPHFFPPLPAAIERKRGMTHVQLLPAPSSSAPIHHTHLPLPPYTPTDSSYTPCVSACAHGWLSPRLLPWDREATWAVQTRMRRAFCLPGVLQYTDTRSSKTEAGSTGQFACVYMPLAHVCRRFIRALAASRSSRAPAVWLILV